MGSKEGFRHLVMNIQFLWSIAGGVEMSGNEAGKQVIGIVAPGSFLLTIDTSASS